MPETIRAGGLISRMIVSAMVDLPEPDSPTKPETLLGMQGEGDVLDRVNRAAVGIVVDGQVLDAQDVGLVRAVTLVCSRTSCEYWLAITPVS